MAINIADADADDDANIADVEPDADANMTDAGSNWPLTSLDIISQEDDALPIRCNTNQGRCDDDEGDDDYDFEGDDDDDDEVNGYRNIF